MDAKKFRADIHELAERACKGESQAVTSDTFGVAEILVKLYRKNLVKINHSALELVCAKHLIKRGYDVKVEHRLDKTLVCDLMGSRTDGNIVVEIETGYVPPEAALDPVLYAKSRIASKVARYSGFAKRLGLGTTPTYILDFPGVFLSPEGSRLKKTLEDIKAMTDRYYDHPPVSIAELKRARLDSVFVIDVDAGETTEVDPGDYLKKAGVLAALSPSAQDLNRKGSQIGAGLTSQKQGPKEREVGLDF